MMLALNLVKAESAVVSRRLLVEGQERKLLSEAREKVNCVM